MEPGALGRPGLSYINKAVVLLVLLGFFALAMETEPALPAGWRYAVDVFNVFIVVVFAVEYCVRVWVAGENPRYQSRAGRLRYMCSFYAITDLIAFLPELVWMILAASGMAGGEALLVLRVLRLARLAKLARFIPAFDVLTATIKRAGSQLLTTLAMALALVYVSAVMLYFIEGIGQENEAFASIPRALWWAIATLTTVGYGDVYPVTTLGRIAASFIALAGIGVVALPAGVFASAFADELRQRERDKAETERSES
ncbi:MAG: ion transporter [Pseudomonadota bacterium]